VNLGAFQQKKYTKLFLKHRYLNRNISIKNGFFKIKNKKKNLISISD